MHWTITLHLKYPQMEYVTEQGLLFDFLYVYRSVLCLLSATIETSWKLPWNIKLFQHYTNSVYYHVFHIVLSCNFQTLCFDVPEIELFKRRLIFGLNSLTYWKESYCCRCGDSECLIDNKHVCYSVCYITNRVKLQTIHTSVCRKTNCLNDIITCLGHLWFFR